MHIEAYEFVAANAPTGPVAVLDVGGRNINGTVRGLFDATTWTVVDLIEAPDVDIVGDITSLGLTDLADVVLCLEVLEHAEDWRAVVAACVAAAKPGATIIITAAGPDREPHSAIDGGELRKGEHYQPITVDDLTAALAAAGATNVAADEIPGDVRAVATLPKATKSRARAPKAMNPA